MVRNETGQRLELRHVRGRKVFAADSVARDQSLFFPLAPAPFSTEPGSFSPSRDEWTNDGWRGWWGDNPPYHAPTFILTQHPRDPIVMDGGTTFYFVADGITSALAQAKAAAGNLDVKIAGGVSTVRQYLQAGEIDTMHLVMSPIILGSGEALLSGINLPQLGYKVAESVSTELATHVFLSR